MPKIVPVVMPVGFQWNKIDDDKLPEGRRSVLLSMYANFVSGFDVETVTWSGVTVTGYIYRLNTRSVSSNVTNLSGTKSISLDANLQVLSSGTNLPILTIFVPDSGQIYQFGVNDLFTNTASSLNIIAALPIYTNANQIFFCLGITQNTTQIRLVANINNFEIDPFVNITQL